MLGRLQDYYISNASRLALHKEQLHLMYQGAFKAKKKPSMSIFKIFAIGKSTQKTLIFEAETFPGDSNCFSKPQPIYD